MTLLMREREKYKEGVAEGEIIGEIRGVIKTYEEVGFSFQETVRRVSEKFDLSLQQSEEEVNKYWM